MISGGLLSLAPEYILDGKWTTMVVESTLNLTVSLHGTTQTRCIILPKVTNNASEPSTTSLAIASVPSRLFDTKVAQNPQPEENKDLTSRFDYI